MATSLDSLVNLANLVGTVRGSSQTQSTSGGTRTQTTQRDVDQVGIDRVVQRLTSGQGGQAAISGAARGAGLYNSTSEQLMLNDLNARIAGEIANITAPTTTREEASPTVTTIEQPGVGIGKLLMPLAAASLLRGPVSSMLGLGGDVANTAGAVSSLLNGASATPHVFDLAGTASPAFDPSMLDDLVAGPGLADSLGTSLGEALPPVNALLQVPVLGPLLGGLFGGFDDSFGANLGLTGLGSALAPLTGGISAIIAPVFGLLSSIMGGGSVVCTALHQRGLLDRAEYEAGSEYLKGLHKYTIKGYHFWGKPLARKIANGNALATKLALPWATQRTKLLAGTAPAWKLPLGVLTKYVGEPACFALGWALTKFESGKEISHGNKLVRTYQAQQ